MKGSLNSLVLTALLVINSLFQPHQYNNLVAADSTYEIILSASLNNTDEGANGCTSLQCRVVLVDDEADLFMEYQQAARSSRMLVGKENFPSINSLKAVSDSCPGHPTIPYSSTSCLGKVGATDRCKVNTFCRGRTAKSS
jgi:hypothetical protein